MIADSPKTLLVLLAVLTFLGVVIGYCVALIVVQRAARKPTAAAPLELADQPLAAQPDLTVAGRSKIGLSRETGRDTDGPGTQRPSSPDSHAQQQAERIQYLEDQLASMKAKQLRMQRELTSDATAGKELELTGATVAHGSGASVFPTLSQKVDVVPDNDRDELSLSLQGADSTHVRSDSTVKPDSTKGRRSTLVSPLTREIDIPTLAESELADSVDELDFDVSGTPDSGARGRG